MQRHQLEHIIRAASGITGATEFVVFGSQAVLGQFPHAPEELLASIEADVFSLQSAADTDLIDGSIGEGSPFHRTFGYYAMGLVPTRRFCRTAGEARHHRLAPGANRVDGPSSRTLSGPPPALAHLRLRTLDQTASARPRLIENARSTSYRR